jgi:hypothetical protein
MKLLTLLLSAAMVSTPALAENLSKTEECSYGLTWEGPGETSILVLQSQEDFDKGDRVVVAITNSIWNLKEDSTISPTDFINDTGEGFVATPMAIDNGFVIGPKYDLFEKVFGSSGGMSISIGKKEIDSLNLTGAYSNFLDFKYCHQLKVDKKRESDRKKEIERRFSKDPFSK